MLLMGHCLDEANIRQRVLVRVKRVRRRIIAAGLQIIGGCPPTIESSENSHKSSQSHLLLPAPPPLRLQRQSCTHVATDCAQTMATGPPQRARLRARW